MIVKHMDTSILLTTYHREDDCIFCLTKLLEQKTDYIEILLLDDLHYDSVRLNDFCVKNGIKYIHTGKQKDGKPKWRVPGFALNIGAKASKGDYLILGNAEIYQMSDDTVQKMHQTGTVASPRVWDQPTKATDINKFRTFNKLDRLPFFMGVPRKVFFDLGGYDEDMIGYGFEDTDLVYRLSKVSNFVEVNADVVHIWNARGLGKRPPTDNSLPWQSNRVYADNLKRSDLDYNRKIFETRKNQVVRNQNREWGKL